MGPEKIKSLTELIIDTGDVLDEKLLFRLLESKQDSDQDLLLRYVKKDVRSRFEQIVLLWRPEMLSAESYDTYIDIRSKLSELLEEKDGIIDTNKREQAKLLLKTLGK